MTDMQRILVIRLGRAGDIVMITAAIKAILKKHPDARIDVLTSPDGKRLLKGFDARLNVSYVHERKSLLEYFQRKKIIRAISQVTYSDVYSFEMNPSVSMFYAALNANIHQLKQATELVNYAHLCLELVVGKTDQRSDHEWVWLPVTEKGRENAKQLLASQGIDDNSIVIGFHPSFSGLKKSWLRSLGHKTEKAWPVAHFGKLARMLLEYAQQKNIKLEIVMDLMPEDRSLGEDIVKASNNRIKLFIPTLDFERYKAMLERMKMLVVPNTGPMHIAGAVGTNLVALFGNIPPEDSGAYVPQAQRQFLHLPSGDGVAAITPEMVFDACVHFLPES